MSQARPDLPPAPAKPPAPRAESDGPGADPSDVSSESLVEELAELARNVATAPDVPGIYRALRSFAERTSPTIGLFVSLLDEERLHRVCVYASSEGEEVDVSTLPVLPLTDSPASRAITTGEVIITEDLETALAGMPSTPVGSGPMSMSSVSVPLKVMGTIIGAFDVQAMDRSAYRDRHIAALMLAADLAAIATQNLRLREQEMAAHHSLEASRDAYRQLSETLEGRVAERTEWLSQANEQLESFSYSVSHDLRAPLRAIEGFANLLADDHARQLDEEGLHYLARIQAGVQRMHRLLESLLEFSRVTVATPSVARVDLDHLVADEIADVKAQLGERTVLFDVGALGSAECDPDLIRQVWRNLLDNAVKFTSQRADARVEVGSIPNDGQTVYFVRDNGAGFSNTEVDRLFVAFQRLHRESDFPGSGIGLAIVARIIQRHRGRIWAEGERDRGATFRFTLGDLSGAG